MKKKTKENITIGIGLVLLSLFLHYIHYLIFKDAHHTLIFLVADIAFIPMEVFFTTLIIDRLLEKREKEHLVEKLNMLVGVFYTEMGTKLLGYFVNADENINELRQCSIVGEKWDDTSFHGLQQQINSYEYKVNLNKIDLDEVGKILKDNRDLLITFISNENLHDHETFTEMLMSLIHIKDEIDTRWCLGMENYEKEHVEGDISIAYKYLTFEWCHYMNYLSKNYPSLFTKALINNPFDLRGKKEKDAAYLKQYKLQIKKQNKGEI